MAAISKLSSARQISSPPPGAFRRKLEWLLSPEHFQFKLLLGTAVGVMVILVLAVTCFVVTYQNQKEARFRAHTVELMRLSSMIENDISALENAQRGYLLAHTVPYQENFERCKILFQQHAGELCTLIADDSIKRKRVLKMREIVLNWLRNESLAIGQNDRETYDSSGPEKLLLGSSLLVEARDILHSIERDEQIALNQRVREQEWAVQSIQILDFIPRMEGAAYEMQKEKRGFVLTGDPAFIESYKRATANFYTFYGHLAVLVADSPTQIELLERIRARMENWILQCAVPDIEARRAGTNATAASRSRGEEMMTAVRRNIDTFTKDQMEIYNVRSGAAARERILTASGIDFLCGVVAVLMIASSSYSFVICRRQFKKLKSADIRIRSVINNILDGMVTVDRTGVVRAMNPAAQRMFGYGENDFVGDPFARLIPKCFDRKIDGASCSCEWDQLAQRTGGIILALARTRHGATFPIEIALNEIAADREKFYVAMIRDVTERTRFEEQLAAEKNSLAVTLGSIGDGVITTDLNGCILIMNPACEALTGWSAAEAAGRKLKAVLNITAEMSAKKRPRSGGYRSEAEAILLGTPERSTLTTRDGTKRVIEQVAAPISDGKNELCGVVLVFRDITQRLRDEAERRKAETLDQLGLLAGGIAHDFNNLLTAIIGNISLVSMLLPPNDQIIERLSDAKNASLRARDLAQQLLTFARGGAPIKQTASAAKLIEETVSFSLRGTQSRSEINTAPDLWPAEFDSGQISQVIANLVVNADQAMPDGGTVHVRCENYSATADAVDLPRGLAVGEYIQIQVTDEGVGISEKCLKRIFDPYFTTKAHGSGLGLATTYSIIKNHGGLILVESELQRGTTFTVYLPASGSRQPALPAPIQPQEESAPTESITGAGRVLIVDDEEAIRMLVDFTLTRLGYVVSEADTALKGIDLYRQALQTNQRFDLVILDLTLPGGMGGKDALKALLEIDPTVNAIVSSGYATDATMSRYEDLGFRGVIAKPYEASALGRIVRETIESGRAATEQPYELQQAC
ncbi:MAG: PAS domain S-box protein [Chthoniobacterales bacterium]|nr:PAS domain S-box protein [Chthoniobacterales bacterium]